MTMLRRSFGAVLFVLAMVALGCTGGPEGAPPLFNAKDTSVQCPTGQVGWDFSTGGNDTEVSEVAVSREITVDSATLGSCNYKEDFAASCDGRSDCTRLVRTSTSPSCSGGALQLTYHCGEESPLVHAEPVGRRQRTNGDPRLPRDDQHLLGHLRLERTHSEEPGRHHQRGVRGVHREAALQPRRPVRAQQPAGPLAEQQQGHHRSLLLRRRHRGAPDGGERRAAGRHSVPAQRRQGAELRRPHEHSGRLVRGVLGLRCANCANLSPEGKKALAAWDARVRASCEGKRSCRIPVPDGERTVPMYANYWCTGPQAPERKLFYNSRLYTDTLELFCADPIEVCRRGATARTSPRRRRLATTSRSASCRT